MHNKLNKTINTPLYLQLKHEILRKLELGDLQPGNTLPTEKDLCNTYGISRYPVRQALKELESEGFLTRTRGKGTFINESLPTLNKKKSCRNKTLGLVLGTLKSDFEMSILSGFEKQARKLGYQVIVSASEFSHAIEIECIDGMISRDVLGVTLFPCEDSEFSREYERIKKSGVYLSLLDRKCNIYDIDYIGSDNFGGAYSAVRHIALNGYQNVACVSMTENVSSINERIEGYLQAVDDFNLNALTHINVENNFDDFPYSKRRFFVEKLRDELLEQKEVFPLGLFVVNDTAALQCLNILTQEGYIIGKDVGIVGFDNEIHSEYSKTPLTSVAQNGLLIGSKAAKIAIDKIEGKTTQIFSTHIPTQLVIRKSCGE